MKEPDNIPQPPDPEEFWDEDEPWFVPCSGCDGHDACFDFGCAYELGLGHLVKADGINKSLNDFDE